jgi:hypothetical protein
MRIETALEVAAKARLHPPRPADPTVPPKVDQIARHGKEITVTRDNLGRFLAGHTAPGPGKPVGGRGGRLAAAFIDDLLREWPRSGRAAIRKLAREHPSAYLKLMARIVRNLRKASGD